MANINSWQEAFSFLYNELMNELENHADITDPESVRIKNAIITSFSNLNQEIGIDEDND